jgi:hypothetical protein
MSGTRAGSGLAAFRRVLLAIAAAERSLRLSGQTMPLRDHFHSPLDDERSWEELHGGWPMMIVASLATKLPPEFTAAPCVRLRTLPEIDAATDLPDQDAYEVRVYDTQRNRRLVAAVEIVSPANKDRPEHRRVFAAKCAELLRQHVSVTIVDLVTTRNFNLYGELLELIGQPDPFLAPEPPPLYAVACRGRREDEQWHFETWAHTLTLGRPLPTLPLWLANDFAVPLELEPSYEETCRLLRIP